ncbi:MULTISPECIES: isochorismate synthase [unclassified Luteococcus]|uniref:isochorismate synthase n=1 Tax=unclassified Luteococcus TaxID=2639923 RepID=UPI00313BC02F
MRARTVSIPDPGNLERFLPDGKAQVFLRRGDGVVGIGEVARFTTDSLAAADVWWGEFVASLENETELPGVSGTGPVAFGSFSFDQDHSDEPSVLIVPEVVIGRRRGQAWMTRIGHGTVTDLMPAVQPDPVGPGTVELRDGSLDSETWQQGVAEAVAMIKRGEVSKVVLARDIVARAEHPIDPRWLVNQLVNRYRDCWTYLVDRTVGSSPEMLVRTEGGLATSRVLAGTIRRPYAADPSELATVLTGSMKDLREHEYAVESVAAGLEGWCTGMNVPDAPYVLELPNVLHLATDITGVVREGTSSLALAAALHPSAAVCGTPTQKARELIAELEHLDRGHYAGPVGWIDSSGDGEWAIALRGGQLSGVDEREMHLYAGCGIVRESVPEEEVAETMAKFTPMRQALTGE